VTLKYRATARIFLRFDKGYLEKSKTRKLLISRGHFGAAGHVCVPRRVRATLTYARGQLAGSTCLKIAKNFDDLKFVTVDFDSASKANSFMRTRPRQQNVTVDLRQVVNKKLRLPRPSTQQYACVRRGFGVLIKFY